MVKRAGDDGTTPGLMARLLIVLIILYRHTLSAFLGRTCRFLPTCSEYALDAVRRHGAWRGLWLGFFRVTRCRPGGASGYDPVPEDVPSHGLRFWRYACVGRATDGRSVT